MDTHTRSVGGPRPLSKYARKVQERRDGTRAPFEFKETRRMDTPPRAQPTPQIKQSPGDVVRARVIMTAFNKGCLFLATEDGTRLFMGLNVLQAYCGRKPVVSVGSVLEGRVSQHPNGKGPRMHEVTAIVKT